MPKNPRARKFETLFDGDEIDGKVYELGETVTGLDAATAAYLQSIGRIAAIWGEEGDGSDEEADGNGESAGDDEAAAQAKELFAAALAEVKAGNIPDDLRQTDSRDGIIGRESLEKTAESEGVTLKSSWQKAEVVAAIIVNRNATA